MDPGFVPSNRVDVNLEILMRKRRINQNYSEESSSSNQEIPAPPGCYVLSGHIESSNHSLDFQKRPETWIAPEPSRAHFHIGNLNPYLPGNNLIHQRKYSFFPNNIGIIIRGNCCYEKGC
jgi:hypothetical protein